MICKVWSAERRPSPIHITPAHPSVTSKWWNNSTELINRSRRRNHLNSSRFIGHSIESSQDTPRRRKRTKLIIYVWFKSIVLIKLLFSLEYVMCVYQHLGVAAAPTSVARWNGTTQSIIDLNFNFIIYKLMYLVFERRRRACIMVMLLRRRLWWMKWNLFITWQTTLFNTHNTHLDVAHISQNYCCMQFDTVSIRYDTWQRRLDKWRHVMSNACD